MDFQFDSIKSHFDTLRNAGEVGKAKGHRGAAGIGALSDRSWFRYYLIALHCRNSRC